MEFFANYGLFILLAVLLVFMFWNSRKRMQKQKLEQEAKARQTIPGAEVLLQGGLYGTIVAFDPDNLDQPAQVEIAPGTVIKVHSQAILRVVDPVVETELGDDLGNDAPAIESIDDVAIEPTVDPESRKKTED
jgi:preprotein translocase subunit YajC